MDIHPIKRLPLRNLNPEVDFRFYGSQLYYIHGLELMKLIFAALDVSLTMGLTRCYKTEGIFTFIINIDRITY